jgi:hypothetical protein
VVARPDEFERYHDALPALEAARVGGWTQVILSNHIPELPEIARYLDIDRYMDRVFTSAALPAERWACTRSWCARGSPATMPSSRSMNCPRCFAPCRHENRTTTS